MSKRQTGRTTRMLAAAMDAARAGRAVYVVGADANHARALLDMCPPEARSLGVKFESARRLPELDMRTGEMRGAHPNCLVFIDHYAVETRVAWALNEMTRFDKDGE